MHDPSTASPRPVIDYSRETRRSLRTRLVQAAWVLLLMLGIAIFAAGGYAVADLTGPKIYTATGYLKLSLIAQTVQQKTPPDEGTEVFYPRPVAIDMQKRLSQLDAVKALPSGWRVRANTFPETHLVQVRCIAPGTDQCRIILKNAVDSVLDKNSRFDVEGLSFTLQWAKQPGPPTGVTSQAWRLSGAGAGGACAVVLFVMWRVAKRKPALL